MKSNIFINSTSFGNNSSSKWKKVEKYFPNLTPVFLTPTLLTSEMKNHIQIEDTLLVGGGDGTIHHILNSVFQTEADFKRVRIGVFGLGSSCSFLRSFENVKYIAGVPIIAEIEKSVAIDIGQVKFKNGNGETFLKFFAANGSIGFLALGNLLFNSSGSVNRALKGLSTEIANNYTFIKSLMQYQPIPLSINNSPPKNYLNIQFLKSKYYTGNYLFERNNSPQSGNLDIHLIDYGGRWNTLNIFYHLSMKNEYPSPGHVDYLSPSLHIKSQSDVPIELDGEVYFGNEFWIECISKRLNLMSDGVI